jgi:hypothetical protein
MPKSGNKSSGGGQKRTANDSSPAKPNTTQPAKKKANLSDKVKEIDLLKHQLNEQNILEKLKNLNKDELVKYGISRNDLHEESDDEKHNRSESNDDREDDYLDNNKMEVNINTNDTDNQPYNEAETRKQEFMKKYFELKKKADEYFIEFVDLGGDKNLILNNNQTQRKKSQPNR